MAETSKTSEKRGQNGRGRVIKDVPGRIADTVEAMATEPPAKREIILDAAFLVATMAEVVAPPVAVAAMVFNRLATAAG